MKILTDKEINALEKEQARLIDELTNKDLVFIEKMNRVLLIEQMLIIKTTTTEIKR